MQKTKNVSSGNKKADESKGKKYTVASLFAGCGGMDLGFHQAGFEILWANDFDHWACETFKRNFGPHIVEADIAKVDFKKIPKTDLILGGFPCQDFSMLWKRGGLNTTRGNLYRYFVELVKQKRPRIFIAENVKGLLTANGGEAIKQIQKDFSDVGYDVTVNLVNFADYGAPQLRQRVLIIGVKKSLGRKFELPKPSHSPSNYVTSKNALAGAFSIPHNNEHQKIADKTREMLKLIPPGGNFTNIPKSSKYYVKGMISHVYRRLDPNKPSTTLIASGGGGTWGYHYDEPRPLTNRERARLFGYPDDFIFEGSIAQVRKQIGNSVPPVAIKVVAKAIKKFLDSK